MKARSARRRVGSACLRLHRLRQQASGKSFSLLVGGGFAEFGSSSVIQPPVRLNRADRIAIGSDVFVGAGAWLQVLDEPGTGAAIEIGDGTAIAGTCVLSAVRSIRIGRKVLLARNVYVSDHAHAFTDISRAVLEQGIDSIAPVQIDDGAWLGQNVVVGPGVRIGCGAVIGANSVVLDDVPDRTVAVGAPARPVRQLDLSETPLVA